MNLEESNEKAKLIEICYKNAISTLKQHSRHWKKQFTSQDIYIAENEICPQDRFRGEKYLNEIPYLI